MADVLTPDICVIGAGAGGVAAALEARRLGGSVVLVERDRPGGAAFATGAVPAKALAAAARRAHLLRTAAPFGIANAEPKINARGVFDHVHETIAALAPTVAAEHLLAQGVTLLEGEGRFVDRHTLAAGDRTIRAKRFVVATGARPRIPDITGLASVPYFTSRSIFDNPRKLTHLLVVGAGLAGLELAQSFRRLGSDVTVVEAGSTLLPDCDPELAEIALRRLREEGVVIRPNTTVSSVQLRSLGVGVVVREGEREETLDISHILVAQGDVPDVEALELKRAGIARGKTPDAPPVLDAHLLTSNRQVSVIGDATGTAPSPAATVHQARLVVRHALRGDATRFDPLIVPRTAATDPEIAEIGVTEPEARGSRKSGYSVVRRSLAENDKARAERESYGLVKLVLDRRGRLIGAGIVGTGASELIALFGLAIANKLSPADFGGFVAAYPSLSQVVADLAAPSGEAAPALAGPLAALRQLPWARRFL